MLAAASAFSRQTGRDVASPAILTGLLGRGIQLSRTPAMHEAEGAALGLRYVYRLFDTDRISPATTVGDIVDAAELCGFAGLNVTYPYKVAVIEHLDELSPAAEAVGAVNTIVLRDGRRRGHNTDLWGFAESFRRNMADAPRENVLLVGAGGAGAAVAHALLECGVGTVHIHDQDATKAEALAGQIATRDGAARTAVSHTLKTIDFGTLDGIVNATPVGMASMPGTPVPPDLLHPGLWVADIIYFPLETELLRQARNIGCRVLPGAGMAVFQAARAFEHFTGLKPDEKRMEAAFNAFDRTAQ